MDLYSYANGDPVNNLDPDGRIATQGIRVQGGPDGLTQSLESRINRSYYANVLQPGSPYTQQVVDTALASNASYGNLKVGDHAFGHYFVEATWDNESGMQASRLRDRVTGQNIVSYRGTEPSKIRDWLADGSQNIGLKTAQYDEGIGIAQDVKQEFGANIWLTGHSLGGGIASAAALVTQMSATTYNSAGLNPNTLSGSGVSMSGHKDLIQAYFVNGEVLSGLQDLSAFPNRLRSSFFWRGTNIPVFSQRPQLMPDAVGTRIPLSPASGVGYFGSSLYHSMADSVLPAMGLPKL